MKSTRAILFLFIASVLVANPAEKEKLGNPQTNSRNITAFQRSLQSFSGIWYGPTSDNLKVTIRSEYEDRFEMIFDATGKKWTAICYPEANGRLLDCSGRGMDSGQNYNVKASLEASAGNLTLDYATGSARPDSRQPSVSLSKEKKPAANDSGPFQGCATGSENVKPFNESFEKEVLQIVNQERAKKGLSPLQWNDSLARAARYHAADMAGENYFEHDSMDRKNGRLVKACPTFKRIGAFAYSPAAENIAAGSRTPAGVMQQWMNSPGHRNNILAPGYSTLGVGLYQSDSARYGYYWVQNFGH